MESFQPDHSSSGRTKQFDNNIIYFCLSILIFLFKDLPSDVIKKQKKAISDARKPSKEEVVFSSSSDSDSELSLSEATTVNNNQGGLVERISAQSGGGDGEERINAETQTAIRGISFENVLGNHPMESSDDAEVSFPGSTTMDIPFLRTAVAY